MTTISAVDLASLFLLSNRNFVTASPFPSHLPLLVTTTPSASIIQLHWSPCERETVHYLPFCVWFVSLSKISCRFIHVVTNDKIFFHFFF